MKGMDAKDANIADKTAQIEESLQSGSTSLESLLKAKRDCLSWLAEDFVDKVAVGSNVCPYRPGVYDAIGCEMQERKDALREMRVKLTAVIIELKSIRCNAKVLRKSYRPFERRWHSSLCCMKRVANSWQPR